MKYLRTRLAFAFLTVLAFTPLTNWPGSAAKPTRYQL